MEINHLSKLHIFTTFLSTAEALLMTHNDLSGMHLVGQKAQFYVFNRNVGGTCQPHYHI